MGKETITAYIGVLQDTTKGTAGWGVCVYNGTQKRVYDQYGPLCLNVNDADNYFGRKHTNDDQRLKLHYDAIGQAAKYFGLATYDPQQYHIIIKCTHPVPIEVLLNKQQSNILLDTIDKVRKLIDDTNKGRATGMGLKLEHTKSLNKFEKEVFLQAKSRASWGARCRTATQGTERPRCTVETGELTREQYNSDTEVMYRVNLMAVSSKNRALTLKLELEITAIRYLLETIEYMDLNNVIEFIKDGSKAAGIRAYIKSPTEASIMSTYYKTDTQGMCLLWSLWQNSLRAKEIDDYEEDSQWDPMDHLPYDKEGFNKRNHELFLEFLQTQLDTTIGWGEHTSNITDNNANVEMINAHISHVERLIAGGPKGQFLDSGRWPDKQLIRGLDMGSKRTLLESAGNGQHAITYSSCDSHQNGVLEYRDLVETLNGYENWIVRTGQHFHLMLNTREPMSTEIEQCVTGLARAVHAALTLCKKAMNEIETERVAATVPLADTGEEDDGEGGEGRSDESDFNSGGEITPTSQTFQPTPSSQESTGREITQSPFTPSPTTATVRGDETPSSQILTQTSSSQGSIAGGGGVDRRVTFAPTPPGSQGSRVGEGDHILPEDTPPPQSDPYPYRRCRDHPTESGKIICECGAVLAQAYGAAMMKNRADHLHWGCKKHSRYETNQARIDRFNANCETDTLLMGTTFGDNQFVPGVNEYTLLIDIPLEDLGTLVVLQNALTDIPQNHLKRVRQVFIKYMEMVIADPKDELKWKKLLLLPTVLFVPKIDKGTKGGLSHVIQLLLNDKWNEIRIGHFRMKIQRVQSEHPTDTELAEKEEKNEANTLKRVMECAHVGEIGKSLQNLLRSTTSVPANEETVEKLRLKHPAPGVSVASETEIAQMLAFKATERIEVSSHQCRNIIMKAHKKVRSGACKLKMEHLQVLIGRGNETNPDEIMYANDYAKIMELVINLDAPDSVRKALRDIELAALPKGTDVRPVGMLGTYRKVATLIYMELVNEKYTDDQPFTKDFFGNTQLSQTKNGTERVVHLVRMSTIASPEMTFAAMDAENAFNRANRMEGLVNIMHQKPSLLPFARDMYGPESMTDAFFQTQMAGVVKIQSQEGCTQGDVMGTYFHGMTLQRMINRIGELLKGKDFVAFYVDDGNIGANHERMMEALTFVKVHGPKYGYHMRIDKGSFLIGRCGSYEEALIRKRDLMDLGILEKIIHIHPDDFIADTDAEEKENAQAYGMTIVGSPVGSDLYVQNQVLSKIEELREVAEALVKFKDNQVKQLQVKWCFNQKINYWFRTNHPMQAGVLIEAFELMQKELLCSMLNARGVETYNPTNLPERVIGQCRLNNGDGGLGFGNLHHTARAAYAASVTEAQTFLAHKFPNFIAEIEDRHNRLHEDYKDAVDFITSFDPEITTKSIREITVECESKGGHGTLQNHLASRMRQQIYDEYLGTITNPDDQKWFIGLRNPHGGLWLDAAPKHRDFILTPTEFTTSLLLRLRLDMPWYSEGASCNCLNATKLDTKGYHLTLQCGKNGYRNQIHNNLQRGLGEMCIACGVFIIYEERGTFQSSNPDCNLRGDITVLNNPGPCKRLVTDVRVTHSMADKSVQEKNNKYSELSTANGLGFLALVFESNGRLHSDVVDFISAITDHYAEVQGIKAAIIQRYWLTKLSFILQKGLAISILHRSIIINGRQQQHRHAASPLFISQFAQIDTIVHPIPSAIT